MRLSRTAACALLTVVTAALLAVPGSQVSAAPPADPPATPASAAAVITSSGPDLTSRAFFIAILRGLKAPTTQANLDGLYAVENREGDNDRFNPLNVVQREPGSSSYNSIGVQRYANFRTGVDGTVTLLSNPHWVGVRAALRGGHSTAAVLAAFGAAYTWDSAITFSAGQAARDGEAVRDVGGRYADPGLAARRAVQQRTALEYAMKQYTSVIARQATISRSTHEDFARQQGRHLDAQETARVHGQRGAVLAAAAAIDHRVMVKAMIASYTSSGAPQALELLTSRSPSDYLDAATLQQYTADGLMRVLKRYRSADARAQAELGTAAVANAVATRTAKAMTGDRAAWTRADTLTVKARGDLVALLRVASRHSILQPLAAARLAQFAPDSGRQAGQRHS